MNFKYLWVSRRISCITTLEKQMKKLIFIVLVGITFSCSSFKESGTNPREDEIFITRKYIGDFIEYRQTGPDNFAGINLIWIKTSMDSTLGKISAYGKKCEFRPGERLFLTRNFYAPGSVSGFWIYMIENDSTISYRVTEYQYDKKIMVQTMF
jgi:hypothetical protein